jgi:hypothetical protein
MKIIDNIDDFDLLKVGYTLRMEDKKEHILKEITAVDLQLLTIDISNKKNKRYSDSILDLFQSNEYGDIVFPCSLVDVPKYFPEYYI